MEPFVFRLNFDVELVSKIEVSAIKSTTIILGWSELLLVMKENPDFGFLEKVEIPKKVDINISQLQAKERPQFKESVGNIDSKRLTKRGFNWMFYSGFLFFSTKFRKFCSNHAIFDRFIEYKEEISIKESVRNISQRYI